LIYLAYQAQADFVTALRATATGLAALIPDVGTEDFPGARLVRRAKALQTMLSHAGLTHHRPPFDIGRVSVAGRECAITEEVTLATPFATLLHFRKDRAIEQPRVLVVAPLSGHFATLLRNTVETLLADHDVWVTDWHNARDVPVAAGRFGLDEYTAHIVRFLEAIGPGAHLLAVCQPCVSALASVAVMAQDNHPAQPASMTLMAGPIDCRVNPTRVNEMATSQPIEWFERHLISTVPWRFAGAGRRVYPGFVQLSAFMSMNLERHIDAQFDLYRALVDGDDEKADHATDFYDEYFAVLDLAAEFYLETVQLVFQEYALARGTLRWQGTTVEPRAIRRTALLTVEGEKDDICSLGQTLAAHDLCSGLRPYRKRHHMQAGVGHYGVFSGRRWQNQIYPIVRNVVLGAG
jgi:polyhydroxyalkanoate depolymerase